MDVAAEGLTSIGSPACADSEDWIDERSGMVLDLAAGNSEGVGKGFRAGVLRTRFMAGAGFGKKSEGVGS